MTTVKENIKTSDLVHDPLWYKDAIIYQLHIKAFFDSDKDGMGDFAGLTAKLDYLKELGINTLWLLPFYPSPLRDDGYDIANYCDINPSYGTMDDFKKFVQESHARGLRVITELVINHTSDQHPWFQRARKSPVGSSHRNFYVWSDTDQKFPETRIIFNDTESSNWAWDTEAKAYYWHRFFSHQPDLNFENPEVLQEVLKTMYFWLDTGVDGLRLDAIPYLCVREGSNNENLPETHEVIKKIRAALDAKYTDRMLLAEANQWPEDVMHYFGEGDECHMAFHFPLMPRIYMSVAQEDRHPITDIMYQTPDIPSNCQWAIFLRNHDELTLEMVTDRERDYLWNFYAADKRARINFGIRRRLAPLMDNDRRKIELLNSLLMSMPGTPIIYYGDELGMGDNIYLGDRNGVRTPMQWSPDRNGGFSYADPAQLYLPAIMDPIYGYQSINVESQARVQNSLLNWMRKLIAVARSTQIFGRGTLRFLTPSNRKILAYIREYKNEQIVCAANLSRSSQAVELNLKEYGGYIPVEMLGDSEFPAVGELPYLLTLPPYGFYWFRLAKKEAHKTAIPVEELLTLVLPPRTSEELITGNAKTTLENRLLPLFLVKQRWYKARHASLEKVSIIADFAFSVDQHIVIAQTSTQGKASDYYVLGLGTSWESKDYDPYTNLASSAISRVRRVNKVGILYEAATHEELVKEVIAAFNKKRIIKSQSKQLTFNLQANENIADVTSVNLLSTDQSNTSIKVNDNLILKIIRQPSPGINPEEEIGHFLTEISPFERTPRLRGSIIVEDGDSDKLTVGLLQEFISNQGDGWHITLEYLARFVTDTHWLDVEQQAEVREQFGYYVELATQLGRTTGQLHNALSKKTNNAAFDGEKVSASDRKAWIDNTLDIVEHAFENVKQLSSKLEGNSLVQAQEFLNQKSVFKSRISSLLPQNIITPKIRVHGDYHLGQVLLAQSDFYIVDFEGEPTRSLEERRQKNSPFKDVAGMLRSFDYAAATIIRNNKLPEDKQEKLQLFISAWREVASNAFLSGYNEAAQPYDSSEDQKSLIQFFTLAKALYEVVYESQQRSDWIGIPINGALALINGKTHEK